MLSISDLNKIIKYYAYKIPQRIEEIEHFTNYPFQDPQDDQEYEFIALISRYNNYTTTDEKEIKLAAKLLERIIQIFEFFKNKSKNQNLLTLIQSRIEKDLTTLTSASPLRLGEFFSFIHLITKRGCIIRPPAEKKRTFSKCVIKEPQQREEKIAPTFSLFNIQKRTTLSINSNKHLKANSTVQKIKPQDVINGVLSGLDLDRVHLTRMRDGNYELLLKDALRRNEKILSLMRRCERKKTRKAIMTEYVQEGKEGTLAQLKLNIAKGGWLSKKRRPILASRKKNNSIKQNLSILV